LNIEHFSFGIGVRRFAPGTRFDEARLRRRLKDVGRWVVEFDTGVDECGGVVGVGGFEVTDGSPEVAVGRAREGRAARAFVGPGSVGLRVGVKARKERGPTTASVGER
jgi:hypothetical protein